MESSYEHRVTNSRQVIVLGNGAGRGSDNNAQKMFSYRNDSLNQMDFMAGPRRHFEKNIPDVDKIYDGV